MVKDSAIPTDLILFVLQKPETDRGNQSWHERAFEKQQRTNSIFAKRTIQCAVPSRIGRIGNHCQTAAHHTARYQRVL